MNFQTDKSLSYDPKKVIHQRRLDMNLKGYEAKKDEVLVSLANIDLLDQIQDGDKNNISSERSNPEKVIKD